MNKEKEVEVIDSREAEEDLMVKVVELIVLCMIKENMNGKMMTKTRPNGNMVVLTEEVLVLIEEELIHILEVVLVVIVSNVVKKGIDILNVDLIKMGRIIEIL